MYGSSWYRGHFMKNFLFDIICNITQEPQDSCTCGFIGKRAVKNIINCCQKYYRKLGFDQLATASNSTVEKLLKNDNNN